MSQTRFVGPIDRLLYMRSLPGLEGVDTRSLGSIADQATERFFKRGEFLLDENVVASEFFVIVSGEVRVHRGGRRLPDGGPSSNIGLLSGLTRSAFRITAEAATDVIALRFALDVVVDIFEENFRILQNVIRLTAHIHRQILPRLIDGDYRAPWSGKEPRIIPQHSLDVVEKLVLLREGEVFQKLGLEALALMAMGLEQGHWKQGDRLWEAGDPADHLLLILHGDVECTVEHGQGRFRAGPGYPLGNLETLARDPRWYSAVVHSGELITLRGNHENLFDVMEDDFDVALDFLAAMSANALRALERLAQEGDVEPGLRLDFHAS